METFETYRSYLFALAYRMLGSTMDAEDMVQETYLRYQTTPPETILSLKAYLTTIISRLCLQHLQLARRKREAYLGSWLPEPLLTTEDPELARVEEGVQMEESISLAFLILLEQLQPAERAVFLLREVFEYEYAEIAAFLGKSEAACRQLLSRARKHLGERRPRLNASPETQKHLLSSFAQAVRSGEMSALMKLLAEEVTFWGDGGGHVKGAATHPIRGREAVVRFLLETGRMVWQSLPREVQMEVAAVNGQPALITRVGSRPHSVLTIEVEAGQIRTIRIISNPEKLTHV